MIQLGGIHATALLVGLDVLKARGPGGIAFHIPSSMTENTAALLKELHGRQFNTLNVSYSLPADAPEHDRLGLQHEALRFAVGGLYQAREDVNKALAAKEGKVKPAILDVGTGSGIWAVSMALEFPESEVIGVDLAPVGLAGKSVVPANCRFEIHDANNGFVGWDNRFDVVHARCLGTGIKDRDLFFQEIEKILRPGGVFLFVDGDLHLYSENYERLPWCEPGEPKFSWVQRALSTAFRALKNRGLPIGRSPQDGYDRMNNMPAFENIGSTTVFVPLGAWPVDPGDMMGKDAVQVARGMRPLIIESGLLQPQDFEELISNAVGELEAANIHSYSGWHYSWARKVVG